MTNTMKKYIILALMSIFLLTTAQAKDDNNYSKKRPSRTGLLQSGYSESHNLFGFFVDGAYSNMLNDNKNFNYRPQGHSETFGILYEFQYRLLSIQVGLAGRYQYLSDYCPEIIADIKSKDAWGYDFTLHSSFSSRKDESHTLYFQLPIMFGISYKIVYAMAGFKMNVPAWGTTKMGTICNTYATYEQYISPMQEMDNHGFRKDVEISQKGEKLQLHTDFLVSAELGFEFNSFIYTNGLSNYRLRLAAFIDYGLKPLHRETQAPIYDIPLDYRYDISEYKLNHLYNSQMYNDTKIHNLFAGVKMTILFGRRVGDRCVTCQWW